MRKLLTDDAGSWKQMILHQGIADHRQVLLQTGDGYIGNGRQIPIYLFFCLYLCYTISNCVFGNNLLYHRIAKGYQGADKKTAGDMLFVTITERE